MCRQAASVRTSQALSCIEHSLPDAQVTLSLHLRTSALAESSITEFAVRPPTLPRLVIKWSYLWFRKLHSKRVGLFLDFKHFNTIFSPYSSVLQYISKHRNKVTTNSWPKLFFKFISVNTLSGLQNMHIFYAPHLAHRHGCEHWIVWLKMFLFHF